MSDMKISKPIIKIECVEELVACKTYCERHERYVDEILCRLGDDKALEFIKSLRTLNAHMPFSEITSGMWKILEGYYKIEVLDEVEWRYLKQVITPFRKNIVSISKVNLGREEYLKVKLKNDKMCFPNFPAGTMYKGMIADKYYTLEELGL